MGARLYHLLREDESEFIYFDITWKKTRKLKVLEKHRYENVIRIVLLAYNIVKLNIHVNLESQSAQKEQHVHILSLFSLQWLIYYIFFSQEWTLWI